jgi:hypothetical protein
MPATLMVFYDRIVTGVRLVIDHFNGMAAFLARDDAGEIAVDFYDEMTPTGAQDIPWWEFDRGTYRWTHVEFMELLLAQPELLDRMSRELRCRLLRTVLEFHDVRTANSLLPVQHGYYLMGHLLESLSALPALQTEDAAALTRFMETGPLDRPVANGFSAWTELTDAARAFLAREE